MLTIPPRDVEWRKEDEERGETGETGEGRGRGGREEEGARPSVNEVASSLFKGGVE